MGKYVLPSKKGFVVVVGIAFLWALGSGPFWGLITLGEILCGFSVYKFFFEQKNDD